MYFYFQLKIFKRIKLFFLAVVFYVSQQFRYKEKELRRMPEKETKGATMELPKTVKKAKGLLKIFKIKELIKNPDYSFILFSAFIVCSLLTILNKFQQKNIFPS